MSKILFLRFCVAVGMAVTIYTPFSQANSVELAGLINTNIQSFAPTPPSYLSSGSGLGYEFIARVELGPGMVESGFLFAPVSMTLSGTQESKFAGNYWMLPLLYRYEIWAPYFSLGVGGDFAIESGTTLTVAGNPTPTTANYKSHFGALASLQVKQDVGENLSIILDIRHRIGLSEAFYFQNTSSKVSFTTIALGIMKHLEM